MGSGRARPNERGDGGTDRRRPTRRCRRGGTGERAEDPHGGIRDEGVQPPSGHRVTGASRPAVGVTCQLVLLGQSLSRAPVTVKRKPEAPAAASRAIAPPDSAGARNMPAAMRADRCPRIGSRFVASDTRRVVSRSHRYDRTGCLDRSSGATHARTTWPRQRPVEPRGPGPLLVELRNHRGLTLVRVDGGQGRRARSSVSRWPGHVRGI
jgi:hypothetical protein